MDKALAVIFYHKYSEIPRASPMPTGIACRNDSALNAGSLLLPHPREASQIALHARIARSTDPTPALHLPQSLQATA